MFHLADNGCHPPIGHSPKQLQRLDGQRKSKAFSVHGSAR
jgi:hypothetical protein